jgi:hypothetical protein
MKRIDDLQRHGQAIGVIPADATAAPCSNALAPWSCWRGTRTQTTPKAWVRTRYSVVLPR